MFFGHVIRREKLERLVTTGMNEGKRSTGKQREKLLDGLKKSLEVGRVTDAPKATRDKRKIMIAYAKEHSNSLIDWC